MVTKLTGQDKKKGDDLGGVKASVKVLYEDGTKHNESDSHSASSTSLAWKAFLCTFDNCTVTVGSTLKDLPLSEE